MDLGHTGWAYGADGVGSALAGFLGAREARPRLLGLGEPMHGVVEFPRLRNRFFLHLVEHEGYRSVALESGCLVGLTVDDFVVHGEGTLDDVMRTGFSHGFGDCQANRDLVGWMREYNEHLAVDDRLRFYGFDAPIEMTSAESPRTALTALHAYLADHLEESALPCGADRIDQLVGDDGRWTDPAVAMDPTRSVGRSAEADELRLLADDLVTLLATESPRLVAVTPPESWWRARLYGRTAQGLLRYHAGMADTSPSRLSRLLGLRDEMMAANLTAVAAREERRGPTLAFAHNGHLQREPTTWHVQEQDWDLRLQWWSAGALVDVSLGDGYAFLATAVGTVPARGLAEPAPDTLEGTLAGVGDGYLFDSARLATALGTGPVLRQDTSSDRGYFPLDPAHLGSIDGVVYVREVGSGG